MVKGKPELIAGLKPELIAGRKPLYADPLGFLTIAWMRKHRTLLEGGTVLGVGYSWSDIIVPAGFTVVCMSNCARMLTVERAAKLRLTGEL
jgi:hypothetical protein